jgi:demethylmenaquinone methyltransferase / 2-methoxy-6-polyprenyl-1,4-benzoquinol methylase
LPIDRAVHAPPERPTREPNRFARQLFAPLPSKYDRLALVLSLGQDRRWRRAMVDPVVRSSPTRVLDVATGPAGVALQIADRSSARVVGVDLSEEMLARGQRNIIESSHDDRITLVRARGEELPFADATFDALTFTYLLRYVADPVATMAELARVVRPGGVIANLEFAVPPHPVWHTAWWGYTRLVLPVSGAVMGGRPWFDVGRFLGPNISAYGKRWPPRELTRAWQQAGITDVQWRRMSLGGGLVMWGRRAS